VTSPGILVGADDRTGALEAAGAAAEATQRAVAVVVGVDRIGEVPGDTAVVVDIGSRHLTPDAAARRAAELDGVPAGQHVHKIDSTLRGNWAHELAARSAGGVRPVLLVPALPALGRTCRDGVVMVDGRPVGHGLVGNDPLSPPASSRPADLLAVAGVGADGIVHVTPSSVGEWLQRPSGVAVCDASTDRELVLIARAASERREVLLAGTAGLAAGAVACFHRRADDAPAVGAAPVVHAAERALVVCGSLHPMALEQVRRAVTRGATALVGAVATGAAPSRSTNGSPEPVIVLPPPRRSGSVVPAEAVEVARALAAHARELELALDPDVLIIIGGDTAAAVLGHHTMVVCGTVLPGAPWAHRLGQDRPVITRAGGFGGPDALVDLLWGTLTP
jgi:uncharacterized protein YgbK (DUF1537 family)